MAIKSERQRKKNEIKKAGSCVGSKLNYIDIILYNVFMKTSVKIEKIEWHPLHSHLMMFKSKGNPLLNMYCLVFHLIGMDNTLFHLASSVCS